MNVEESLRSIKESASKLNDLSNNMTAHVNELEDRLHLIGAGITAEVQLENGDSLAYERCNGKFRITVGWQGAPRRPYCEQTREVKLRSFMHLEKLTESIAVKAQREAEALTAIYEVAEEKS